MQNTKSNNNYKKKSSIICAGEKRTTSTYWKFIMSQSNFWQILILMVKTRNQVIERKNYLYGMPKLLFH